jgi:antitoxin component YwqK of YwqJK toxin-antitoxin module
MNYKEWVDGFGRMYRIHDNNEDGLNLGVGSSVNYYYPNGSIEMENFFLNGILHREDGPAKIMYNPDGSIYFEYFYLGGLKHRKDGPAIISHVKDSICEEAFYINGGFLGLGEKGFWALWKRLTEVERNNSSILKYLARYS